MTLDEAKKKLTEREFSFLEAMLSQDQDTLRSFGDDAVLLAKSVEFKILAAGGIDEGPVSVENSGTQLTLFEVAAPEVAQEDKTLLESLDKATKKHFEDRGEKSKVKIPVVSGASTIMPNPGDLDGLERSEGTPEPARARDILDDGPSGHAPFRKGDVIRGDRVMYKGGGGIHRVKGVDRTTDPHTVKIEVFGKIMAVSREMVAKVAPTGFDRRWHRRRGHGRRVIRYPTQHSETTPQDGYDPQDNSS